VGVEELALGLPKRSWRKLNRREGSNAQLSGRFARVRVRPAHDRDAATETIPEEWLLIEWPEDEKAPTKFWLSTLDETVTFAHLVHTTKMRWRIEGDYLEFKQEIGLGHFEGRGWRGFHHHATLCIAAYGFLISERAAFSPLASALRRCPRSPSHSRKLSPTRRCPSALNATCRTRLRRFDVNSPRVWLRPSRAAPAAASQPEPLQPNTTVRDAVGLEPPQANATALLGLAESELPRTQGPEISNIAIAITLTSPSTHKTHRRLGPRERAKAG
jgi:hypothetical protein